MLNLTDTYSILHSDHFVNFNRALIHFEANQDDEKAKQEFIQQIDQMLWFIKSVKYSAASEVTKIESELLLY